ncbi:hypothetical protein MIND_01187000 [Mycena indigotica]|uniref:Uncharacterized protein n=1 Tax=Mycena indigotica TaxID=2126181 RepID=A0A8H6S492_9AGAR|nr:uncharacterized protein MIND_01187000 [Mycena indigotica]KAF7292880.1 hypothetical protein MIND_01187000 [Mycena indigotica]
MSKPASSRSSRRSYRPTSSTSSTGLTTEYDYAAAYGEPALSDASSDEQIARAISESKKTVHHRAPPISRTSSASSWTFVGEESPSRASSISNGYTPTPTPRYAADETVARSLARSWNVASLQSDIIHNPSFSPSSGPPLVVRSPSPARSSISASTSYTYRSPPPNRPLSPLSLSARSLSSVASRSPSITSISSVASTHSNVSASIASIISSVARSSRHEPLDTATRTLRASLPPSLSRSVSSSSSSIKSPRAGSVRSLATSSSRRSTSSVLDASEKTALARLHAVVAKSIPCANPGCGALIPPATLDTISFPAIISDLSPPRALFAALHARCPTCTQNHCRGCGQPTGCAADCCCAPTPIYSSPARRLITYPATSTASPNYDEQFTPPPCSVPTHCPAVRALGALFALFAFDRAHVAISQHGRSADKALIGPLHSLTFFIAPPPHHAGTPRGTQEPVFEVDPALPVLVRLSRVPTYAASLLRAEADVGRWIDRAPAYSAILRVLRALGDTAGCRSVLTKPIAVSAESGLQLWTRNGEVSAGSAFDKDTLRGLIRRLEGARAALLRLAGALEFGPTVRQAHALCDGVLYLLLQDALGDADE